MNNTFEKGQLYWFDYGEKEGSIQCGNRPVLIVQGTRFNQNAPTVIIAAITTVTKKQYLASHIILPGNTGLNRESMVMLEQISAVNKESLGDYIGKVKDRYTLKRIDIALRKEFDLFEYVHKPNGDVRCLCQKCKEDYMSSRYIVRRVNPEQNAKAKCDKCDRLGYDYMIIDKSALENKGVKDGKRKENH